MVRSTGKNSCRGPAEIVDVDHSDRSLGELLTRSAELLVPLYLRLEELIRQEPVVMADETPIRIMAKDKTRRGYIWTFRTAEVVLYRASAGRSGETPQRVLGATTGTLLTDGYSGYNQVTTPAGRQRAGCWAHARRNFVEAMSTEPELAGEMIALIAELYGIESRMRKLDKLGSAEHQQLRQTETAAVMKRIDAWLTATERKCLPKGPLGKAISYAQNQWTHLQLCCSDATIPLDNNLSENALRAVAVGRKNWLFAGNDAAAQRFAVLLSLLMTAVQNAIDPELWLRSTLLALACTPSSALDSLLPLAGWAPPTQPAAASG